MPGSGPETVHLKRCVSYWRAGDRAIAEGAPLSAFGNFFRGFGEGRFPRPLQRERRGKRGGAVRHASAMENELGEVIGDEPTPDFALSLVDECRRLLDRLGDPELRAVAMAKLSAAWG